ncbi:MAG: (d)CMP kinase [Chloroflexota bacterium]
MSELNPAVITIDGPAASGKSTIGYRLAEMIDYLFFDTGVMYRAVTWAALHHGVDVGALSAVGTLAEQVVIDIAPPDAGETAGETDGRQCTVLVDGQDVTWAIRTPDVDRNVSAVAANAQVRVALSSQQQRIGHDYGSGGRERAGIIMVGRDIGTVIMPDAPLKIYMDASPEERARRRYQERIDKNQDANYDEILADLIRRDKIDSERDVAPLKPADDAKILDTSALSPDEVLKTILEMVRR